VVRAMLSAARSGEKRGGKALGSMLRGGEADAVDGDPVIKLGQLPVFGALSNWYVACIA
jgi:hypothetical protein